MLDFHCFLLDPARAMAESRGLKESLWEFAHISEDDIPSMAWFDPKASTTFDVAYKAVVPLSKKVQIAYSPILMRGKAIYPKAH